MQKFIFDITKKKITVQSSKLSFLKIVIPIRNGSIESIPNPIFLTLSGFNVTSFGIEEFSLRFSDAIQAGILLS